MAYRPSDQCTIYVTVIRQFYYLKVSGRMYSEQEYTFTISSHSLRCQREQQSSMNSRSIPACIQNVTVYVGVCASTHAHTHTHTCFSYDLGLGNHIFLPQTASVGHQGLLSYHLTVIDVMPHKATFTSGPRNCDKP